MMCCMKITTFIGKKTVRKKIGFLVRSRNPGGRNVLARRRSKGRHAIAYGN